MVVVAVLLIAVAVHYGCNPSLSKLKSQADSLGGVYSRDTASYSMDTLVVDSVLAVDSVKPSTQRALKKERASANRVIKTAEAQKENYRKQIKALTPTLRIFAEGGYGFPLAAPAEGDLSVSAGLALKIKQDLDAQVFVRQPLGDKLSLNIGVRKNWRLF